MGLQKKIAYRLRGLREAAGLSQQDVAERAELSLSLIAKMEQGRKADPRASTLLALAGALNVRAGQLLEDLEAPPEGAFPAKGKKEKEKKKEKKKKKKDRASGADAAAPEAPAPEAPPNGDAHPSDAEAAPAPKRKRRTVRRAAAAE